MSYMNQPGIILLREGTDSSQGKAQLVSNINACQVGVLSPRVRLESCLGLPREFAVLFSIVACCGPTAACFALSSFQSLVAS